MGSVLAATLVAAAAERVNTLSGTSQEGSKAMMGGAEPPPQGIACKGNEGVVYAGHGQQQGGDVFESPEHSDTMFDVCARDADGKGGVLTDIPIGRALVEPTRKTKQKLLSFPVQFDCTRYLRA